MKVFSVGGKKYRMKKCSDGHVRKLRNCDWTEQDVCPQCDAPFDLYDPKTGKTAGEERDEDRKVGR